MSTSENPPEESSVHEEYVLDVRIIETADESGDIRTDHVDGGVVYRGELEEDYNVSTLEPVIVGPDFTDGPEDANDALRNIDNVYVMDNRRVLCCEDGFDESNRSTPTTACTSTTRTRRPEPPHRTPSPGRRTERGDRGASGRSA